ncbi:MAG: hypothetical protein IPK34_07100 [Ramlibacter sp.]|nr:hypothetical protein [Ramlibacter sp.]
MGNLTVTNQLTLNSAGAINQTTGTKVTATSLDANANNGITMNSTAGNAVATVNLYNQSAGNISHRSAQSQVAPPLPQTTPGRDGTWFPHRTEWQFDVALGLVSGRTHYHNRASTKNVALSRRSMPRKCPKRQAQTSRDQGGGRP